MQIATALVIDDDERDRMYLRMHLEDAGIDVAAPGRTYATVEELTAYVALEEPDVVICDHRLQRRQLAPFFGAEAVAKLVQQARVALLMTSYFDVDYDTSIRRFRQHIPALLTREQLEDPENLIRAVSLCEQEIAGNVPPERQLVPTVALVADVGKEDGEQVFDVFLPGWNAAHAVRMPGSIMPPDIAALGEELRDRYLLVEVNTRARDKEELFFGAGSIAGPIDPADWPETQRGEGVMLPFRSGDRRPYHPGEPQ